MEPLSLGAAKARQHLTKQRELHNDAIDAGLPEYGVVSAVSGDLVAVKVANDAGAATQLFAKTPLPCVVGTPGLLFPIKGGGRVFMAIGGAALTNPITLTQNSTSALLVETAGGTDRFRIDTSNGIVQFPNGVDLIGYSDAYTTQKWSIDSTDGSAIFAALNSPFLYFYSDQATDTTTNTATFVDKISTSGLVLPTGTWEIRVAFWGSVGHSASANVDARTVIDGNNGATYTKVTNTTLLSTIFGQGVQGGVGSGPVTLKVQFKGAAAGTSSFGSVIMLTYFRRTA